MNRDRRHHSLLIIALAGLVGSPALSQEEFSARQLAHCAIDIPVHCDPNQFGGGRIVKCLQQKRTEITPECRAAVTPTDFADGSEGLTVEVAIDKLKSRQGTVIVMLSEDPNGFPRSAKRTVIAPIGEDILVVTFRRLKASTYAITAVHDLDDNGKYEAGEGFAASNGVVGPPSFAASAIKIEKNASVAISMRYP